MIRFEQENASGFVLERSVEERELALDLSTEVRGLAANPELIALLLTARAELLEFGERIGRELKHFDRDRLGGIKAFLDQRLGGSGGSEGDRLLRGRRRGGVFEREDGEDIRGGDPSVRKVRSDEEAVPYGCEGADVKQTVSFRVRTDGFDDDDLTVDYGNCKRAVFHHVCFLGKTKQLRRGPGL